jgi:hypothetical protein
LMLRICAFLVLAACVLQPPRAAAQATSRPTPAVRAIYVDRDGVIRWRDNRTEVALFGANYTLPSASDYRAAGYLKLDRKRLINEDMAHFARMGWDALRLSFWGDWENSDRGGNLIVNDHLDLQDYLIAKARERGIYILLSPITTYNANWPDALQDTTDPGFSKYYDRGKLGTDTAAFAAQVNYIRQLLEHVNPYTRTALKNEPSILFIEPINEPWHRPENLDLSVRYINALVDAVRSTGADKLVFHNVSQDFRITEAIRKSKMQGISFGWYPTALNAGYELHGNYLRTVDHYSPMLSPQLSGLPRIVYEFDSPDLVTGYMYPAMARTFRSVGAQYAAMFAYDMLRTSSRNLGWQTHYLNLVYTPRKAVSAAIAAEAMRRLPRMRAYGEYPQNTRFGDFRVSYEENLSELVATDAFMHAGTTRSAPPDLKRLARIAGFGSSPVIDYDGLGAYFLDKIRDGVWRLELYPDAVAVRDPFIMPSPDKIVTRAIYRSWPMRIGLPDLGSTFTVQPLSNTSVASRRAESGRFMAEPGVYVLSANGPVARNALPDFVGQLRVDEFHAPAPDSLPMSVHVTTAPEYLAGEPMQISARVVDVVAPDSVTLFMRPLARGWFRRYPMQPAGGYDYRAVIPGDSAVAGLYEFVVSISKGGVSTTFPDAIHRRPWDWDFSTATPWRATVVQPETPLRIFRPGDDARRLAFTRIGDAGRQGLFGLAPSAASGEPVFHLELPVNGNWSPDDYTASHVIKDLIEARGDAMSRASAVRVRLRGLGASQVLHLTLVERDGTSWSTPISIDAAWSERSIPLSEFKPARSVMLPQGFPGQWLYWLPPPAGRGIPTDRLRARELERLQFSLRKPATGAVKAGEYGVEIEYVKLVF